MNSRKVAALGLDGLPFFLLDVWIKAGFLPHLASLSERVSLLSTVPPISPVAWTGLATGREPPEHGVLGFTRSGGRWDQDWGVVTAGDIRVPTLWQLAAKSGLRAVAANFPMTYPASVSAGGNSSVDIVSGWIGAPHFGARDVTWPPELRAELFQQGVKWEPFNPARTQGDLGVYLREGKALIERRLQLFLYLIRTRQPDLFMGVFYDTDRVLHQAMGRLTQNPLDPLVLDYFQKLDQAIGELLEELEGYIVLVVSDHGMQLCQGVFDLNTWLLEQQLIQLRRSPISQLKYGLWRRGWTTGLMRDVLLRNRAGREVKEVVSRTYRLRDALRRLFFTYRDVRGEVLGEGSHVCLVYCPSDLRETFLDAVALCPQLGHVEECAAGPDFLVWPSDPHVLLMGTNEFHSVRVDRVPKDSGMHCPEGIFLARDLPAGTPLPSDIVGAGQLIADLLGLEIPVVAEIKLPEVAPALTTEEEAVVREHLCALSYL